MNMAEKFNSDNSHLDIVYIEIIAGSGNNSNSPIVSDSLSYSAGWPNVIV